MSRIDELIRGLCPEGVPAANLGDLCVIETGRRDANEGSTDGKYLFFTTARATSRIDSYQWDCEALLVAGNANVGNVKYYVGKFDAYQRTYVLSKFLPGLDVKYLYYALQNNLNQYLDNNKNVAAMTYIVLGTLKAFKVAIPPLEIQREIVSILDKFTQLEAELEAELEARRVQYEEARNNLLNFDQDLSAHPLSEMIRELCPQGVALKRLAQCGTFSRGGSLQKKDLIPHGLPAIHYGQIHTNPVVSLNQAPAFVSREIFDKSRTADTSDLVIADTSEDIDGVATATAWLGKSRVAVSGHTLIFTHTLDPKFVAYFFRTESFRKQKNKKVKGVKVKDISASDLGEIKIPAPPIEIQTEIVSILDILDALVHDITYGLPAEIAARRKQYEYYRNKLLTFKEPNAS